MLSCTSVEVAGLSERNASMLVANCFTPARRRATAAAGVLSLILLGSACASSPGSASSGTASSGGAAIKVGVVMSTTGPIAAIGEQELAGVRLAAQAINAAGGVDGHRLQLVVTDDDY